MDEFRNKSRGSLATIQFLTSQIQELQEGLNYVNDSREFHDVGSICSEKLSHVPSQPAVVPSPRAMFSRDQSLRLDTRNLLGKSVLVFDNQLAPIDSVSTSYGGMLQSWNLGATGGDPVRPSTERLVARSEERN